MANFTDKKTGKVIKTEAASTNTFKTLVTASGQTIVDGRRGGNIDGVRHEFIPFQEVPYRIKSGDQSKFFPNINKTGAGIISESIIRDTVRGIVYIPVNKAQFQENYIGVGSHVSGTFGASSFAQVSASLSKLLGSLNSTSSITYAVQEFYNSTASNAASGSFVGGVTASIAFRDPQGSASFSGIAKGTTGPNPMGVTGSFANRGYVLTVDLSGSRFVTHTRFRVPVTHGSRDHGHEIFIPRFGLEFFADSTSTSSFSNTTSSFTFVAPSTTPFPTGGTAPASKSEFTDGVKTFINQNGSNSSADGTYFHHTFKGRVAGDGDSGSLYDFFDFKEFGGSVGTINEVDLVIYTGSTIVANSIFAYLPLASASAGATSSSDTRTVYFASASTTPGFNGIYTGSGGGQATFGSFIHADSNLRTNVDEGFYNPRGPGGGILSGSVSSSVFKFSFVGNNISSNANLRRSGSYFVTRVMQKMQ
tara:strand:+ start:539 stop:1966 length:1428 start_codon:yes stop_codon:yes gene_type:complete